MEFEVRGWRFEAGDLERSKEGGGGLPKPKAEAGGVKGRVQG
jgi:hypothetical protein